MPEDEGREEREEDRTGPLERTGRWLRRLRESRSRERAEVVLVGKCTVAAGASWFIASDLMQAMSPAFAPFTAVMMVQATVYRSIAASWRYVAAVTAGVVVQGALGFLAGPAFPTFLLVALVALALSRWPALGEQRTYVATAAFFAFAQFTMATDTAGRLQGLVEIVLLVLVGCLVGVAVNLLLLPPLRYRSADEGLAVLASSVADLLQDMGAALSAEDADADDAHRWRRRANGLADMVSQARTGVETAQESLRLNPLFFLRRRRDRTSLDTQRSVVGALDRVGGLASSLARGLAERGGGEPAAPSPSELGALLSSLSEAARSLEDIGEGPLRRRIGELDERLGDVRLHLSRLEEDRSGDAARTAVYTDAARLEEEFRTLCDALRAEAGEAPPH
ncbi:aromatic acid exporter family protein [Nocardiopsis potens]|uniref:aromatic acid exporter family protein n=1 Tax=Nocardiopsis potens TaxID=1246458 RepID=UPI000344D586|nr:aromatic acid exporter family protein [Nocardiopsis potens]